MAKKKSSSSVTGKTVETVAVHDPINLLSSACQFGAYYHPFRAAGVWRTNG
jgi:hypothetical protein